MTLDYDAVNQALSRLQIEADAAESHGMLCAIICTKNDAARVLWLDQLLGNRDEQNALVRETKSMLEDVYAETMRDLNSPECDFSPLLPDDEHTLEARTDAVGLWCQGFGIGLSYAGITDFSELPGDAAEIAQDLLDLGKAGLYGVEGSEEDEMAYMEIVEYMRASTLLFYEELNPLDAETSARPNKLH